MAADYSLETHLQCDGSLLHVVTNWISGSWVRKIGEASVLRFRVVADPAILDLMTRTSAATIARIWLKDKAGIVLETFHLAKIARIRQGNETFIDVTGYGLISQLAKEHVPLIESDRPEGVWTPRSVKDIVTALLSEQKRSDLISIGTFSALYEAVVDVYGNWRAQDTNVLAALRSLQSAIDVSGQGYFSVVEDWSDPVHPFKLNWFDAPPMTGEILAMGARLHSVEYEEDWSNFCNRVYYYGEGQDKAHRLTLKETTVTPITEEYIQLGNPPAVGVFPDTVVDQSISDPDVLYNTALNYLEQHSVPYVRIVIGAYDLAKCLTAGMNDYNDLLLGASYMVTDPVLSLSAIVILVSITTDLANPIPAVVELNNKQPNIVRAIKELNANPSMRVDGTRYPTMGRNYSEIDNDWDKRIGDTRWDPNSGSGSGEEPRLQVWDGSDWQNVRNPSDDNPSWIAVDRTGEAPGNDPAYARADHEHALGSADVFYALLDSGDPGDVSLVAAAKGSRGKILDAGHIHLLPPEDLLACVADDIYGGSGHDVYDAIAAMFDDLLGSGAGGTIINELIENVYNDFITNNYFGTPITHHTSLPAIPSDNFGHIISCYGNLWGWWPGASAWTPFVKWRV